LRGRKEKKRYCWIDQHWFHTHPKIARLSYPILSHDSFLSSLPVRCPTWLVISIMAIARKCNLQPAIQTPRAMPLREEILLVLNLLLPTTLLFLGTPNRSLGRRIERHCDRFLLRRSINHRGPTRSPLRMARRHRKPRCDWLSWR
jgi:hypothetical protein